VLGDVGQPQPVRGIGGEVPPVVHDDHVQRQFKIPSLGQAWFTDITKHPTSEGKLYVCAIKDACSNRFVGLSIGPRMTSDLACNALRYAITARSPVGTIVHSDRGGQFRSRAFATTLRAAELRGSMGRVASAADNAAMESFFALLQENVLNRRRWETREELRLAILTCVEARVIAGKSNGPVRPSTLLSSR
jgi:putative transposase